MDQLTPKRWPVWRTSCNLSAQSTSGEPPWKSALGPKFAMTAREAARRSHRTALVFIRIGARSSGKWIPVKRVKGGHFNFFVSSQRQNRTSLYIPKRVLLAILLNVMLCCARVSKLKTHQDPTALNWAWQGASSVLPHGTLRTPVGRERSQNKHSSYCPGSCCFFYG